MTPSTKALLIAPSVQEADGAFLRPDMIPLGPSVYIPGYDRIAIGDKITLTWTGGPTSDGRWTEQKVIDTIDGDIVFHVPTLVLAAAESYEAVTGYVLRRQGSDVDEPSDTATYTVRNHPPIRTIQVRDQNGLPTSIIDHAAEWFEAELPEEVSISFSKATRSSSGSAPWTCSRRRPSWTPRKRRLSALTRIVRSTLSATGSAGTSSWPIMAIRCCWTARSFARMDMSSTRRPTSH